jgi:serine/threonine protein phosphatase 1
MRTLAIGDIHGCNAALTLLLKIVQPAAGDRVVFLGDYIDRGPASREVVETLLKFSGSHSPIFLRGNHEVMILHARKDPSEGSLWQGDLGRETLLSYGVDHKQDWSSAIPEPHWEFFARTEKFFETENHIFVHACLDEDLDMNEQHDWLLYWEHIERLRPHKSGKRIICGHTRQTSGKIKDRGFAVCIDTGPASGGWLSCLDVNSGTYWQANEKGQERGGKLPNSPQ